MYRHAVAPSVAQALDDGADQRVHDLFEANRRLWEFLGDERQRRAGGFAHADREMARLPSHRDDEVPPRRRLGVYHEVLDDFDTVVSRRLVPERIDVGWEVEVVVDRLRDVHDADAAGGPSARRFIAEYTVSSPPIVMSCVTLSRSSEITAFSRVCGLVVGFAREMPICEPPRKWIRLTASVVEADDVVDIALHDPFEAIAQPDDLEPLELGPDGRGADDGVDAGRRSAADQNGEFPVMLHGRIIVGVNKEL